MQNIKKILNNKKTVLLSQLILGFIFIMASIGKIMHPSLFAQSISNYKILPDELIMISAIILPWMELILGILIVMDIKSKWCALALSGLLIIFIIALISALIRGLNIDCGCFIKKLEAVDKRPGLYRTIIRDILLLIPCYIVYKNKS